jgi:hypothetical protein
MEYIETIWEDKVACIASVTVREGWSWDELDNAIRKLRAMGSESGCPISTIFTFETASMPLGYLAPLMDLPYLIRPDVGLIVFVGTRIQMRAMTAIMGQLFLTTRATMRYVQSRAEALEVIDTYRERMF